VFALQLVVLLNINLFYYYDGGSTHKTVDTISASFGITGAGRLVLEIPHLKKQRLLVAEPTSGRSPSVL